MLAGNSIALDWMSYFKPNDVIKLLRLGFIVLSAFDYTNILRTVVLLLTVNVGFIFTDACVFLSFWRFCHWNFPNYWIKVLHIWTLNTWWGTECCDLTSHRWIQIGCGHFGATKVLCLTFLFVLVCIVMGQNRVLWAFRLPDFRLLTFYLYTYNSAFRLSFLQHHSVTSDYCTR